MGPNNEIHYYACALPKVTEINGSLRQKCSPYAFMHVPTLWVSNYSFCFQPKKISPLSISASVCSGFCKGRACKQSLNLWYSDPPMPLAFTMRNRNGVPTHKQ
ncbi:unnamed protein product [Ixodes pacificus]